MPSDYKVCILTVADGLHVNPLADKMNQAVLPIKSKAIISHMIEKFPDTIEFVIAVGHKKESVIDYIHCMYPDRNIKFVTIKKLTGPGTGPRQWLLACRRYLNTPFILFTNNTLVEDNIPPPTSNWYGLANVKDPALYSAIHVKNQQVLHLDGKGPKHKYTFIGLAGIKDHVSFFNKLESPLGSPSNENPLTLGFEALIPQKLKALFFTWHDISTASKFREVSMQLSPEYQYYNFLAIKEIVYEGKDKRLLFIPDRRENQTAFRRYQILKDVCLDAKNICNAFFVLKKFPAADSIYEKLTPKLFIKLYRWLNLGLWDRYELSTEFQKNFQVKCRDVYDKETHKYLNTFHKNKTTTDMAHYINDEYIPPFKQLFDQLNWDWLSQGIPARIHGQLTLDRIEVITLKRAQQFFKLNSWHHDFYGFVEYGDIYYDLAMLYASIQVPAYIAQQNLFTINWKNRSVRLDYHITFRMLKIKEAFAACVKEGVYDMEKIQLLAGLLMLHLLPYYHPPYDEFLYFLAKRTLYDLLSSNRKKGPVRKHRPRRG